MSIEKSKTKLTISINKKIIEEAKRVSKKKHVTISGLVENFLKFFSNPEVYCFKCGEKFSAEKAKLCPKCGWMICPNCKTCGCGLSEETIKAVFYMRRVYEDLLAGRVK